MTAQRDVVLLKLRGHFSHPDWDGMLQGTDQPLEIIVASDGTIEEALALHQAAGANAVLVLPGENEELCILQAISEKGAWMGVPGDEDISLLARGVRSTSAEKISLHVDDEVHHLVVIDRGWDPSAWTGASGPGRYDL